MSARSVFKMALPFQFAVRDRTRTEKHGQDFDKLPKRSIRHVEVAEFALVRQAVSVRLPKARQG